MIGLFIVLDSGSLDTKRLGLVERFISPSFLPYSQCFGAVCLSERSRGNVHGFFGCVNLPTKMVLCWKTNGHSRVTMNAYATG